MNLGEVIRELEVEPVAWPQPAPQERPQEAPAEPVPVEHPA